METTVGAYLQDKGLTPKKAGVDQWQVRCMFCGDSKNQSHRHLYINQEHGAFKCHRCDESGGFWKLQEHFGDKPEKAAASNEPTHAAQTIYERAVAIAEDALFDHPEVVKYLNRRGVTAQTIVDFRIGYMGAEWTKEMHATFDLYSMREAGLIGANSNDFWVYNAILIPYIDEGRVKQLRGKQIEGRTIGLGGKPTRLFNSDGIKGEREVFVCEGEMDAVLLSQLGYPTVGVPGAGAFKDLWLRHFEEARRIFVIPDHDNINPNTGKRAGIEGARRTIEILGPRAKLLQLIDDATDDPTDLTDYFIRDNHSIDEFQRRIDNARGKRLFTFTDSYKEWEEHLSLEGIYTGFKDLDRYVHPGFLPGQVGIVLAKTGVGKTTFATQLITNFVDNDVAVMMLSLEQMKGEIASRLLKISRYNDARKTPAEVGERFNGHFLLNDDNRIPAEDVPFLIEEFEEQMGCRPKVLVVDYLGYWARAFRGGSAYEQTTAAIMELKRIAKQEKVFLLAPHQVSRAGTRGQQLTLDSARDSGAIEETGDFVFGLYAPSHKDGLDPSQLTFKDRADLRLDLLKSRHGNVGKDVRMWFAPMSLAVLPATFNEQHVIKAEWDAFDRSLNYDEFQAERSRY